MAIVAIIPARFGSTRLPGKPLSDIHGKPMVQHVFERVRRSRRLDRVLVATDDERVMSVVRGFGGDAVLTSTDHPTGTDRLAEAARSVKNATIVVNVQGDEPMVDPLGIDAAVEPLLRDHAVTISTLSLPLRDPGDMLSPSVVKVVVDAREDALYFSRSPIPFVRTSSGDLGESAREAVGRGVARKHVGIYVYRRAALLRFASLPAAPLEEAEQLEQLRALHHGMRIRVVPVEGKGGLAVDTPQDLERVRALMAPGVAH